jgi:DNA-binding HxlR family transcriptional regulator
MDLIGDRWALLIVRELMFGPKRFTDLRNELRGISPNVLTQRLEELEAATILRRRQLPPPAASWIYELTDWGRELEEPILSLGRWAARSPFLQQGLPMTSAGLLLAMRTLYQPQPDGGFCVQLDLPHGTFRVKGTQSELDLHTTSVPDVVVSGTADVIDGILFGDLTFQQQVAAGNVAYVGDQKAIERFLRAFPLPAPVPPP